LPGWNLDKPELGGAYAQTVTPNPSHTFDDWIGPNGAFKNMAWYPLFYVPIDGGTWDDDWNNIIKPHIDYAYAHGGKPIIALAMWRWTSDYREWSTADPPSNWSNYNFTTSGAPKTAHDAMIDAFAAVLVNYLN
jgi:hypothetical protein